MSSVFLDEQTDKAALDQKLLRAMQFYATECVSACVCVRVSVEKQVEWREGGTGKRGGRGESRHDGACEAKAVNSTGCG